MRGCFLTVVFGAMLLLSVPVVAFYIFFLFGGLSYYYGLTSSEAMWANYSLSLSVSRGLTPYTTSWISGFLAGSSRKVPTAAR